LVPHYDDLKCIGAVELEPYDLKPPRIPNLKSNEPVFECNVVHWTIILVKFGAKLDFSGQKLGDLSSYKSIKKAQKNLFCAFFYGLNRMLFQPK
jgi:hypothetical protein